MSDGRTILLITLSNIGDALMTTPVMQALHERYPDAVMDIVTDARAAELFAHCPWCREILLRDKRLGWRGTAALVRRLRATRYDLAVDLRTDGLSWLLRARRRLTRHGARATGPHAVERHFAVIMQREKLTAIPPLCLWLTENERAAAGRRLAGLPGNRWLALAPGARWGPKRWPASRFAGLARHLQHRLDAVILLGDESDRPACRGIAAGLSLPHVDLAGQTGLLEAAAVLQRARLFVGNDSGLGHLAAACGCPGVTIFGPGDPERYHPWHPRARWVRSDSGLIGDVRVETVAEAVLSLLSESEK
ncbi:MAG: glycosyltransferase family 9 protein [Gammaproteobacteria bacterium]|jgi:ADP-heptose:LPS heptosyltransferase